MASEVERFALTFPNVSLVKVYPRNNPITGQHVEMIVQPHDATTFDIPKFRSYLKDLLQPHMTPKKISIEVVDIGHRFKRL